MAFPPNASSNNITFGQAAITANSGAINTAETIIVQSSPVSSVRFVVGLTIRVTMSGTCTASAANVPTFAIRIGTAGTTSDTAAFSGAGAASATTGTSIPFRCILELTIRTLGASATSGGVLTLTNNGTTGISTTATQVVAATTNNFATNVEGNFLSATFVAAASTTTCTFTQSFIELIYPS